jgi:hypothetical protein
LQPGGHRFDPGQLHQISAVGESIMQAILNLGVFLVPILAILVGGIIAVVAMILKHQERIAKIERGINPDGPWPQQR